MHQRVLDRVAPARHGRVPGSLAHASGAWWHASLLPSEHGSAVCACLQHDSVQPDPSASVSPLHFEDPLALSCPSRPVSTDFCPQQPHPHHASLSLARAFPLAITLDAIILIFHAALLNIAFDRALKASRHHPTWLPFCLCGHTAL